MVLDSLFTLFSFPNHFSVMPGTPGIPTTHDNKPGYLILQWEEGANGNAPINKFELQYRKGKAIKILFLLFFYLSSSFAYNGNNID